MSVVRRRSIEASHALLPALGLAALALAAPGAAQGQNPSHGPLTYEEGSPLHRLSYTATMEDAAVEPKGTLVADFYFGFSNIFEQDSTATHVLLLDMERLVSSVTLRWGASDRLELGGRLLLETTGAGKLDGLILDWHEALGFGQANRDRFPGGEYHQRLRDGNGTVFLDVPARTLGFEDVRLYAKFAIAASEDARSALSARAEVRVPGGSNRVASERSDIALMVLGRLGLGSWYLHGMLGASTIRTSTELDPILKGASSFLTLSLERSFGPISGLLQYQAQSSVLESFEHRELDRAATNFVMGLSGGLGEHWRWDASFQEDLPADTPAIDFTVGLRISRTW